MIRSMTAYAGGERATPWGTLGCELRSVNHRFLEIGTRLSVLITALSLLLAAIGALGLYGIGQSNEASRVIMKTV